MCNNRADPMKIAIQSDDEERALSGQVVRWSFQMIHLHLFSKSSCYFERKTFQTMQILMQTGTDADEHWCNRVYKRSWQSSMQEDHSIPCKRVGVLFENSTKFNKNSKLLKNGPKWLRCLMYIDDEPHHHEGQHRRSSFLKSITFERLFVWRASLRKVRTSHSEVASKDPDASRRS